MMPCRRFIRLDLISVFVTERDQRVGDMVAGTVVVREREAEAPAFAEVFASPVTDRGAAPLLQAGEIHRRRQCADRS